MQTTTERYILYRKVPVGAFFKEGVLGNSWKSTIFVAFYSTNVVKMEESLV
jgi:hypothetical protein